MGTPEHYLIFAVRDAGRQDWHVEKVLFTEEAANKVKGDLVEIGGHYFNYFVVPYSKLKAFMGEELKASEETITKYLTDFSYAKMCKLYLEFIRSNNSEEQNNAD